MDKSTVVAALAAFGVPVAPNEFAAGMLLSVVVYWVGREMFQKMGDIRSSVGLLAAVFLALIVAILHDDYFADWSVQIKMMAASFFTFPILLGLQRAGKMVPDIIAARMASATKDEGKKP